MSGNWKDKTYGEVFSKEAPRLGWSMGTGTSTLPDGRRCHFELYTSLEWGCPVVKCEETGKIFMLAWSDVLDLALAAGVAEAKGKSVGGTA